MSSNGAVTEATNGILLLFVEEQALPYHFLTLAPVTRKSLRSYTASAKPDFTAERSAVSCRAPSEPYYWGHLGAGSNSSLRLQVTLQDNVLHTGKHPDSYHVPLLSTAINI